VHINVRYIQGALDILDNGDIRGIIDDYTFLSYIQGKEEDYEINGPIFNTYLYGIAFPKEFSEEQIKNINKGLLEFQSTKGYSDLKEKYNLNHTQKNKEFRDINVYEAAGVYFIFIGVMGLSLILSCIPHPKFQSESFKNMCVRRKPRQRMYEEEDMTITTRIELPDLKIAHRHSVSQVNIGFEQPRDFRSVVEEGNLTTWEDVQENTLRLIRATTLSLLLYENAYLEGLNRMSKYIQVEMLQKQNLTNSIHRFINR